MQAASAFTDDAQLATYLESVRENVELLTGQRGAADNFAVVRGDVQVTTTPAMTVVITVPGSLGEAVTAASVVALANDVASLKATLDQLIIMLRTGQE